MSEDNQKKAPKSKPNKQGDFMSEMSEMKSTKRLYFRFKSNSSSFHEFSQSDGPPKLEKKPNEFL